ncbi:RDD family protein [Lipingzhangella sp. LS1_29]|uniref:RDD family protein n=1 Tax=Lipingzhangella rawalii TaxID=2055835 RepID=A0ABU2H553_9ACTN|nr:RDD family protein [Lipingzhangella rawalii]MDS1270411.1 RDD family protein [Lipingzhangella rawalii]
MVHPTGEGQQSVVTGEAVVLDMTPAGVATRIVALALDALVQLLLLLLLAVATSLVGTGLDPAATAAVAITGSVLILVGYPTTFETLTRGRSLGKLALGLRVVGTDGSPERFRQALARGLCGFVEIWMLSAVPALVVSLINPAGRRVGDFLAGTIVVQERTAQAPRDPVRMPPQLAEWAQAAELSRVDGQTLALARQYVQRYEELDTQTRHEMGMHVATAVARHVTPPPPANTSPVEFLAAVLAERRRRDEQRLTERPRIGDGNGVSSGGAWPVAGTAGPGQSPHA